jgi:hypothetical protein
MKANPMLRRTVTMTALCGTILSMSALTGMVTPASATTPNTQLVTAALTGGTANGYGDRPEISPDGTHVTFDSDATNMSSDPPGFGKQREVYERDLSTGVTRLVTIGHDGKAANDWSSYSWPDADGNLVTFTSDATNLTVPATSGRNVMIRNMSSTQTIEGIPPLTTREISVNSAGVPANGSSSRAMISPNGRYVAFDSAGTNMSSAPTNGHSEEYLRDLTTGTTTLISAAADGTPGDALSYRGMVASDGNSVAFDSKSTNLVPGDSNGQEDIFLKNMTTGAITRVSNKGNGSQGGGGSRPYMSPNGEWIIFNSNGALVPGDTNNHTDVYVYNTQTQTLTIGSPGMGGAPGNGDSLRGFITDDGRYIVFNSFADNLAPDDRNGHGDAFAYDTTTGKTTIVSRATDGGPANGNSFRPVPSANGSEITYLSQATNLVAGSSAPAPNDSAKPDDDQTTSYEAFAVSLASLAPDTTDPAATITTPAAASTVRSPLTIKGTATDNVAIDHVDAAVKDTSTGGPNSGKWLQANGTFGPTLYNAPTTLSNPRSPSTRWSLPVSLPDSTYQVQVTVVDTSNNVGSKPSVTFTVSTPPPPPPPTTGTVDVTVVHHGHRVSGSWICLAAHKHATATHHRTKAGKCAKTVHGKATLTKVKPGRWHLLQVKPKPRVLSKKTVKVRAGHTTTVRWKR